MQFDRLKRREFISLLGVAAAAWPVAARAQQSAMPVIGFLDAGSAAERTTQVAAFRKGLAEGGYHVGQNVALEFHWAEGQYERFPELAADFVRRKVSVIVTPGSATAALAAKAATSTIPIVFGAGGDPVKQGLVASFNRPGGNLTGVNFFTAELVAKRMQLLRELVPAAKRVAVLVNPTDLEGYATLHDAEAAAGGLQILVREVTSGRDIDAAFASMTRENADAVLVAPGPLVEGRVSIHIRRREFITLVGGMMAWPVAARAQRADRMRRIGVLVAFDENDPKPKGWLSNFTQGACGVGLDRWPYRADGRSLGRRQC
jgi:putative tryptophan/tyrosine transport system substrate-binding protein